MNYLELIKERHSVRKYLNKEIEIEKINLINQKIKEINSISGLNIQFITNEPKAYNSNLSHYGKFKNVKNYLIFIGKKTKNFHELCGYYGEQLVLYIQSLGLNTCWVALTYKKIKFKYNINKNEKILLSISVGYGEDNGVSHKSKKITEVSNVNENSPEWFKNGVEAALLAPTAINQQQFYFRLDENNNVSVKPLIGFYTKVDLGIVKYHFELGSGKKLFENEIINNKII